ncbi:MAG: hypothetical protein JST91_05515 [Actinobacteria bacterium]|nr:hypothetical protein [Actinomycetota bacterium]
MSITLANTTDTPVALHLTGGVVVVGARDTVDCDADDVALSQVASLCRQGILVAHPASNPSGDASSTPQPPPKRRRRSTGRRGPN